jgi:hypothetical protein
MEAADFQQTTRRYIPTDRSPLELMCIFFSNLLFSLKCCLPASGIFILCAVRFVYHTDMELSPEYKQCEPEVS